jgi:hypothetical protein
MNLILILAKLLTQFQFQFQFQLQVQHPWLDRCS